MRPADLIPALHGVPVVLIASACAVPPLALAFVNQPRRLLELPNDRYLFGLWAMVPLSCLANGWFGGALSGFAQFGQIAFLYIMIRYGANTEVRFRGLVVLLLAIVFVQAVNGIVQYVTGVGLGGIHAVEEGGIMRIRGAGIFNDPNDLALTLITAVPLLVGWHQTATRVPARHFVFALALTLILGAAYLTNSRGGVLALGASSVVLAYARLGKWFATGCVIAGLAAVVAVGPKRVEKIETGEASAQERIASWSEGLQMFKSRPVYGVGWNRFTDFHEQVAHNSFVQILAETGFVGGFFFVGIAYCYFSSLRAVRRYRPGADFSDALIASGAGLLTGAMFLSRHNSPAFYTIIALGASYAGLGDHGRPFNARPAGAGLFDAVRITACEIVAIAAIYSVVVTFAVWGH